MIIYKEYDTVKFLGDNGLIKIITHHRGWFLFGFIPLYVIESEVQ